MHHTSKANYNEQTIAPSANAMNTPAGRPVGGNNTNTLASSASYNGLTKASNTEMNGKVKNQIPFRRANLESRHSLSILMSGISELASVANPRRHFSQPSITVCV